MNPKDIPKELSGTMAEPVPVAHWTLFTTLTDFASPGDIEVFLDEASVDWICDNVRKQGRADLAQAHPPTALRRVRRGRPCRAVAPESSSVDGGLPSRR